MDRIRWGLAALALTSCAGAPPKSDGAQQRQTAGPTEQRATEVTALGDAEQKPPILPERQQQQIEATDSTRSAAKALEGAPETERPQKLSDYLQKLDAMPGPAIAQLVADLDRKSPAWPPAALKLARVQIHLGDRVHAQ